MKKALWVFFLLLTSGLTSCDKVFEYSPYEIRLDSSQKKLHEKSLKQFQEQTVTDSTLTIALLADNHLHFADFKNAIEHINAKNKADLIIHLGDFADGGLAKDYTTSHEIMQQSNFPYFVCIGNHDCLANGRKIYAEMFGPENFTIETEQASLVILNDVFWETESMPDFFWLENQLKKHHNKQIFVFAHIPPFGDQFDAESEKKYSQLMAKYNVQLSVHGHVHRFQFEDVYQNGTKYLCHPSPEKKCYYELIISNNNFQINENPY